MHLRIKRVVNRNYTILEIYDEAFTIYVIIKVPWLNMVGVLIRIPLTDFCLFSTPSFNSSIKHYLSAGLMEF